MTDRHPRLDKVTLRAWREGDRPTCTWSTRSRRFLPPCGPPVVVVTVHDNQWGLHPVEKRKYTLCAMHRARVFDPPDTTATEIYKLGSQAFVAEQDRQP
jgi:hypothetical protein